MATNGDKPIGSGTRVLGGSRAWLIAGLVGALLGAGGVALWSGWSAGREDGAHIRDYLLENPEIIPEAMDRLQSREMASVVAANRAAYETPFGGAWAGAKDGDVVLVEFFDYACSYCRASNAAVDRLLREDPRLKVVWREWPVLGPDSQAAANASLAAARHGDFRAFYRTLYGLGRPTPEAIARARSAAGLPAGKGAEDADREIDRNLRLAVAVRGSGTPLFVVGDQVLHGAVGYDRLKQAVADARKRT
jgi:protein-disulfide isomerase